MSKVDSRVVAMNERLERLGLLRPLAELTPAEQRRQDLETVLLFMDKREAEEKIGRIQTTSIPRLREEGEIQLRIYHPQIDGLEQKVPVMIFIHGGGFITGEFTSVHESCCLLSSASQAVVVSVDYRLAPEHKFPLGLNDCFAAALWVSENASEFGADPSKLVVAGDSAGGNLAAVVCLLAREKVSKPKIAMQGLIYPVTDLGRDMTKYSGAKFGPSKEEVDMVIKHYLVNPNDALNPLVSPLRADLGSLPPAVIITAGNDPLREQAMDYAAKLREAGVEVALYDYPSMVHGFFTLPGYFPQGREAIQAIANHVRQL